jgi:hypothetical protein
MTLTNEQVAALRARALDMAKRYYFGGSIEAGLDRACDETYAANRHGAKDTIDRNAALVESALLAAAAERDEWPEKIAEALCTTVRGGDRTLATWVAHVRREHEAHTRTGNRLIAVARERDALRMDNNAHAMVHEDALRLLAERASANDALRAEVERLKAEVERMWFEATKAHAQILRGSEQLTAALTPRAAKEGE